MDIKEGACVGPKDAQDSLGRSSGLPGTASALCTGGWAREGPRRHGGRAPADGSASEKRNRVRCRMEAIFDFLPQFSSVQSLSLV